MLTYIIRIMAAMVLGFIIGLANKSINKDSSASVFSIICTGAALTAIISTEFFRILALPWVSDPGRISAQIISAMGFLGTGLIWISEDNKVKGLSIAASLWLTAIMGMLIGAGLHAIAITSLVILLFIYWLSGKVAIWKNKKKTNEKLKY